jgi:hypothetical protein
MIGADRLVLSCRRFKEYQGSYFADRGSRHPLLIKKPIMALCLCDTLNFWHRAHATTLQAPRILTLAY